MISALSGWAHPALSAGSLNCELSVRLKTTEAWECGAPPVLLNCPGCRDPLALRGFFSFPFDLMSIFITFRQILPLLTFAGSAFGGCKPVSKSTRPRYPRILPSGSEGIPRPPGTESPPFRGGACAVLGAESAEQPARCSQTRSVFVGPAGAYLTWFGKIPDPS